MEEDGVPAPLVAGGSGGGGGPAEGTCGDLRLGAEGDGIKGDGAWLRLGDLCW